MKSFAATLLLGVASASKPSYYNSRSRYGGYKGYSSSYLRPKYGLVKNERTVLEPVTETVTERIPRKVTETYEDTILVNRPKVVEKVVPRTVKDVNLRTVVDVVKDRVYVPEAKKLILQP